jgi:hypothetical protein
MVSYPRRVQSKFSLPEKPKMYRNVSHCHSIQHRAVSLVAEQKELIDDHSHPSNAKV